MESFCRSLITANIYPNSWVENEQDKVNWQVSTRSDAWDFDVEQQGACDGKRRRKEKDITSRTFPTPYYLLFFLWETFFQEGFFLGGGYFQGEGFLYFGQRR